MQEAWFVHIRLALRHERGSMVVLLVGLSVQYSEWEIYVEKVRPLQTCRYKSHVASVCCYMN